MYFFTILYTTIILHKLLNALDITTICYNNEECVCNNNYASCVMYKNDPPFILPNETTILYFEDVKSTGPYTAINSNTFKNGNLKSITWVSSKITLVGTLNYNNLKYLDLSKNNIYQLSNDVFNNCPQLEYIDLSNNLLQFLPDNLFSHTKLLETLIIENNIFYSIPENLFRETINLKNISLGNPNLTIIEDNAMSNLEKLEYISIENSRIENIKKSSFGEHEFLTNILLNNCKDLKSIDNDFINSASNIETIQLNNCSTIQFLPSSIVSLENLKSLQLSNTLIQPNCHNGWFSQWFINNTSTVIDYKGYNQFFENLNKLDCPPKIYHLSGSSTLQLTKRGIINCMAYGNPPPATTWLVPGGLTLHENKEADRNLLSHPNVHNWDLNQIVSQSLLTDTNGSLHIVRMLRANIGNYTCYVSNKYGNDSKIVEIHLDSGVFFSIKINALLLGIISALGFLMLTILCCASKLILTRLVIA